MAKKIRALDGKPFTVLLADAPTEDPNAPKALIGALACLATHVPRDAELRIPSFLVAGEYPEDGHGMFLTGRPIVDQRIQQALSVLRGMGCPRLRRLSLDQLLDAAPRIVAIKQFHGWYNNEDFTGIPTTSTNHKECRDDILFAWIVGDSLQRLVAAWSGATPRYEMITSDRTLGELGDAECTDGERVIFDRWEWGLSKQEQLLALEELRLVLLAAIDRERRKLDQLRSRYEGGRRTVNDLPREPIPEEVRVFVWRRDGGRCVRCGCQERLEFDHIIPVSRGGANTARNIQLLCELCNRSKGDSV